MKLHLQRILNTNDVGVLYECIFPEFILRFTIYSDKLMRIKAYLWDNDHGIRSGNGQCLKALIDGVSKKPQRSVKESMAATRMRGSGYDTFESMDDDWKKFYSNYLAKKSIK